MMHADKWFPKTTQCPTCGATDIRDCRCDVLRAEKVIKELEAEVERLKAEYPYGEADMDLKDDEIKQLQDDLELEKANHHHARKALAPYWKDKAEKAEAEVERLKEENNELKSALAIWEDN